MKYSDRMDLWQAVWAAEKERETTHIQLPIDTLAVLGERRIKAQTERKAKRRPTPGITLRVWAEPLPGKHGGAKMKTKDSTVIIRQAGDGMDELTSGTLHAASIDYQEPEGWIGQQVRVSLYDENGNLVEFDGELISVEE